MKSLFQDFVVYFKYLPLTDITKSSHAASRMLVKGGYGEKYYEENRVSDINH